MPLARQSPRTIVLPNFPLSSHRTTRQFIRLAVIVINVVKKFYLLPHQRKRDTLWESYEENLSYDLACKIFIIPFTINLLSWLRKNWKTFLPKKKRKKLSYLFPRRRIENLLAKFFYIILSPIFLPPSQHCSSLIIWIFLIKVLCNERKKISTRCRTIFLRSSSFK